RSGGCLEIQGTAQGDRRPARRHPRQSVARRGYPDRTCSQLEKLDAQARIATEYRQHETRLKEVQELLWFSKKQDAAAARERHATTIANLSVAFESLQADVRAAEAKLEALRADHYTAGDALHDKQGAYYAANSEVTRLDQQLAFARDSESRM